VAAAGGRVTQAGWAGGYGNYTCIDHGLVGGARLSTCYGHQQAILVAPGQQVTAGQVIGRVGSTGASTGPHLHFEVRLGGRPVDPLPWI
jgi:murein DD-endopeptidase MepM/ murein hydrolase activator NlpD